MKEFRTCRETLQVLPTSVQYVHHELCGKWLSNFEIPSKCAVELLLWLGQLHLRYSQGLCDWCCVDVIFDETLGEVKLWQVWGPWWPGCQSPALFLTLGSCSSGNSCLNDNGLSMNFTCFVSLFHNDCILMAYVASICEWMACFDHTFQSKSQIPFLKSHTEIECATFVVYSRVALMPAVILIDQAINCQLWNSEHAVLQGGYKM